MNKPEINKREIQNITFLLLHPLKELCSTDNFKGILRKIIILRLKNV